MRPRGRQGGCREGCQDGSERLPSPVRGCRRGCRNGPRRLPAPGQGRCPVHFVARRQTGPLVGADLSAGHGEPQRDAVHGSHRAGCPGQELPVPARRPRPLAAHQQVGAARAPLPCPRPQQPSIESPGADDRRLRGEPRTGAARPVRRGAPPHARPSPLSPRPPAPRPEPPVAPPEAAVDRPTQQHDEHDTHASVQHQKPKPEDGLQARHRCYRTRRNRHGNLKHSGTRVRRGLRLSAIVRTA